MELVLLRRLAAELSDLLQHRRVEQLHALPSDHLVLDVGAAIPGRLWFSASGDEPHLYLREGGYLAPQPPPGFAMAARKALRGRWIDRFGLFAEDRIVELRCGDAAILFEMLPRRGCAYITVAGTVTAVWSPRRGQARPGQPYAAPQRPQRPGLDELDDAELKRLHDAMARGDSRELTRAIDGMTPLLSREAAAAVRAGAPLREAVIATLERAATVPTDARVYSPAPMSQLSCAPSGSRLELAPFALRSRATDRSRSFDSVLAAAAAYYPEQARLRLLQRTRTAVGEAAGKRVGRIERALRHRAEDAHEGADPARLRQLGDLLLANPQASIGSAAVRVVDLYRDNAEIDIVIDPAHDLAGNAERLYRRAQRIERARALAVTRKRDAQVELARLRTLQEHLADIADAGTAAACVGEAHDLGLEVEWNRLADPEVPGLPAPGTQPTSELATSLPGILRLVTSSGTEILVGRSARANDRLTHEIAARHDWWLHAGGPGAHVVVRNPQRLEEPRPSELVAAAKLAAWFSRERNATKVEVHWTQARRVHRVRGDNLGAARMHGYRTIVVRPEAPAEVVAGY